MASPPSVSEEDAEAEGSGQVASRSVPSQALAASKTRIVEVSAEPEVGGHASDNCAVRISKSTLDMVHAK